MFLVGEKTRFVRKKKHWQQAVKYSIEITSLGTHP